MNKKGLGNELYFGGGTALIFLGAWFYGQYDGYVQLIGIIFMAFGLGLIASRL